jgi:hypothetical protein
MVQVLDFAHVFIPNRTFGRHGCLRPPRGRNRRHACAAIDAMLEAVAVADATGVTDVGRQVSAAPGATCGWRMGTLC